MKIDENENISPISFQPKRFTEKLLGGKEIHWNIAGIPAPANAAGGTAAGKQSTVVNRAVNSAAAKPATGETAEAQSGGIASNITDSGGKSSAVTEEVAEEHRQTRTGTEGTDEHGFKEDVDWITRQGGFDGAVKAILNDNLLHVLVKTTGNNCNFIHNDTTPA